MKNLFTLFLVFITAVAFSQDRALSTLPKPAKQYKMLPNSARPADIHKKWSASQRSSDSCNTIDILDYSTYNEIVATNLQISYNGSWNSQAPQPYGNEINSSFITVASSDNQEFSYAMAAYDSLGFANFTNQTLYSKSLGTSTVTLDTLGMFIGVAADDTSTNGGLVGDSLVFQIYAITSGNIGASPVQTQTYAGHDALQPFVVGTNPGYLKYAQIPVNQTFAQGQGFAVKLQFFSGDTSSHCVLAYSYADSCGTVVYQGTTYSSPAYPSPFINGAKATSGLRGNTFYGEIDSTGPTTAAVTDVANQSYYINIPGIPTNCSKLYVENWEFLALVTVNNTLGITINGANPYTMTCSAQHAHTVTVTKTGDVALATYQWSSNVSGSQTGASASIVNPGTYDVTITNSQGCTATDELIAAYASGLNEYPSFTAPSEICMNQAATFTNTTFGATGYSATWNYGSGSLTSQTPNPTNTYTSTGSYVVTLTIDSANCEFNTTQTVTVLDCTGFKDIEFGNNVSLIPNPSNGNVTLTVNGAENGISVNVYNIIGQTVKSFASSDAASVFNTNLDLNSLTNGTYLVKIQSGNKVATKKLVIAK